MFLVPLLTSTPALGQIGLLWPALVRTLLAEPSAAAARARLSRTRLGGGRNFMLADGREFFGVECSAQLQVLTQVGAGAAHLHTNHCFDPVLRRFAQRSPAVTLRYNTELVSFTEDDAGVTSTLREIESGKTFEMRSKYLVGTDGGASAVRHALGIQMAGEPTLTYTTNVVFRTDNLEALHNLRPAYRYIFIGPEGTWATLVAINGRDQWRFSLVGDSNMQTHSEEVMRAAILRAVGKDFDFEILSMLPWIRRQLVADHYGSKRGFLAGDAAHLTSPTGGFGMNTGIQDAVNLSWKLAATLQGWGGEHLLGSYETEMRPIAIRNVSEATGNLKRMLSPRVVSPGPEMFGDSPEAEAKRREFGEAYTELMKREWFYHRTAGGRRGIDVQTVPC